MTRLPSFSHARLLAIVTALAFLAPLPFTSAAHAADDDPMPTSCTGPYECLYFHPVFVNPDPAEQPSNEAWDIVRPGSDPTGGGPWLGTFMIRQHSTMGAVDGSGHSKEQCMASKDNEQTETCDPTNVDQRWHIEPVGSEGVVETDPSKPDVWTPFDHNFYLRSADSDHKGQCYSSTLNDLHADQNGHGNHGQIDTCTDIDPFSESRPLTSYQWRLDQISPKSGKQVYDSMSDADRAKLANYLLGAALSYAVSSCGANTSLCTATLFDVNKGAHGAIVSEPSRIGDLEVTSPPAPVLINNACAAGAAGTTGDDSAPSAGNARVLYNGGDSAMSATLGASGTSAYSTSLTNGISVTVEESFAAAGFTDKMSVTTSVEYGKTWSDSHTISQEVNWTVPPHRYATATLSTSALQLTASWSFNDTAAPSFNLWKTDGFTHMTVPFSADTDAGRPDSVLAIYNTYDRKACNAASPSSLDPQHVIRVENTTHPGEAPVPGDVLTSDADPAWWVVSGTAPAPVTLHYQWYRQRSGEAAEPISNAHQATYQVTGDDVSDDAVLPRFGPYHLFVGVTDVANSHRFDSPEYDSVATDATQDGSGEATGSPSVSLKIANGNSDAATRKAVTVHVSVPGAIVPAAGTISIEDNGEVIEPALALDAGSAQTKLNLATGAHELVAVYQPDPLDSSTAVQSDSEQLAVAEARSRTSVSVDQQTVRVGAPSTVSATVTRRATGDVNPTGQVQFFADGRSLGGPVDLDSSGTASSSLPAFAASGQRQITAVYLGDADFAQSTSLPVTQYAATIGTRLLLRSAIHVSYRGGTLSLRAHAVAEQGGSPQGTVRFYVDGRSHGRPVQLDQHGLAALRMRGLGTGIHHVMARYFPSAGVHAAAVSGDVRVTVRRHGAHVTIAASRSRVSAHQRMVISGKVRAVGDGPTITGGLVRLIRNGHVIKTAKVTSSGTYQMRIRGKRLSTGANDLQVRYVGSRTASIAPDLSRTVTVRRR